MRLSYFFLASLFLGTLPSGSAQTTARQLQRLDSALTVLHRQASFNGVVLVADAGKPVYKKAFGVADFRTQAPLRSTSAFNLASVSKQFTAMLVMMLQEKGRLQFDEPVQQHLPEFPYANITIRHLLTHTSGLPEYFDLALRHNNTLDTLTNTKLLGLLHAHSPALRFQPGASWEYCNTNYVLLAALIEKLAGQPIETFFQQQIARPLGLRDTYIFSLRSPGPPPANRVIGFQRLNGEPALNDLVRVDGVTGDGNVYASAEDLLAWDQALYTEKLVKAKTLKAALSPVQLLDGSHYPYGFGWSIDKPDSLYSHTGSWVGFYTQIIRNTAARQTAIVLSNGSDPTALGLVRAILNDEAFSLPRFQLINNIQLIDGSGTAARPAAVRLRDDRIWETGALQPFPGEPVTDGRGLVLAPGFIDSHSHHFGGLEDQPEGIPVLSQGVTTIVIGQDGSSIPIDTIRDFYKKRPVAINVATYTGQSTLREDVMGAKDLYRICQAGELTRMQALLATEMEKGSLGLSTGLEYEEAFFCNRHEVIELAKIAAAAGGRYISHIRSEDIQLDEAIEEVLEIGREAKLPVQISHIKIAKRDKWGTATDILQRLQEARAAGVEVTADCYPYDFWSSTLRVLFPNRDYTNPVSAELAVTQLCDPDQSIVTRFAPNPEYAGQTISAIAALRRETPAQSLLYLVAAAAEFDEKNPDYSGSIEGVMGKSMLESDVEQFLVWPHTNICSDGSGGRHPRGYGAFTRVLGRYVREKHSMPLETAIYKMTALSAEHLGLTDRGLIRPGQAADLVLLDPATVQDQATIQHTTARSTGIEIVWVNGEIVYRSQQATGKYPGRFIQKGHE